MVLAPERAAPQEARPTVSDGTGYAALAAMLAYPDEGAFATCRTWLSERGRGYPDAARHLREWLTALEPLDIRECQELYTRTFDLNPCCTLDIGYYLFGEDYQRGAFMAEVRSALDRCGIPCDEELPDHLPNLLRWLDHVRGTEEHVEMVAECLLPVLKKMDGAFVSPASGKQDGRGGERCPDDAGHPAKRDNPYRSLLQGIAGVLERDLMGEGRRLNDEGRRAKT